MGVFLEDNPPRNTQFRSSRRALPTGGVVVHTAESRPDLILPDGGAEAVAGFIARRTTFGSYHDVVDSDSVVQVCRYEWEAYHCGVSRGGLRANSISIGLSFACRADQWDSLPESWVGPALRNGAKAAADAARWVESTVGVVIPAGRITADQFFDRQPGFIGHGELDPGRRSDPGPQFPWDRFLGMFAEEFQHGGSDDEEDSMARSFGQVMGDVEALYLALRGKPPTPAEYKAWGADLLAKIDNGGSEVPATLAYIRWALENEGS